MRCVTRQPNGCEENQSQHDLCLKETSSSIVEPEVTGLSRGEVMNDIFPFHESRLKKSCSPYTEFTPITIHREVFQLIIYKRNSLLHSH